ncbi:MAG: hypothetical protein FWB93_00085 [Oscillospiraceae bacterium]|nr:hypothetical protein [Oscillospiraceae bacterium]
MSATRQQLRDIIDIVDSKELNVLYQLLIKFIPESPPLPDEAIAIAEAKEEISRGETVAHDEINWN